MRIIKKIMIFPIVLVLGIVSALLDMIIKAECWVAGVGFLLLAILALLAIFNGLWLQLGIFLIIFIFGIIIMMLSSHILLVVEQLNNKLKVLI